jgi:oxaloacetate decarboxylase alpha subunit
LRRKYGGPGIGDEEVLLRFFSSKEEVDKMRAAGPARSYTTHGNPLLNLVKELARRPRRSSVYIRRGNLTLRLEKRR